MRRETGFSSKSQLSSSCWEVVREVTSCRLDRKSSILLGTLLGGQGEGQGEGEDVFFCKGGGVWFSGVWGIGGVMVVKIFVRSFLCCYGFGFWEGVSCLKMNFYWGFRWMLGKGEVCLKSPLLIFVKPYYFLDYWFF